MMETYELAISAGAAVGQQCVVWLWAPLALWSAVAFGIQSASRIAGNPIAVRPVLQQLMIALPIGLVANAVAGSLGRPAAMQVLQLAELPEIVTSSPGLGVQLTLPLLAYLLVAVVTLSLMVVGIAKLAKLIRETVHVTIIVAALRRDPDESLTNLTTRMSPHFLRRHGILVARSRATSIPFTAGWFRPVIALPYDLVEPQQVEMALLHELAHIRRGHAFSRWATKAIADTFWFHPFATRAYDTITMLQECECDQDVLANRSVQRRGYAGFLFALADSNPAPASSGQLLGTALCSSPNQLTKRIASMNKIENLSEPKSRLISAVSLLAVVGIMACSEVGTPDISTIEADGPVTATMVDKLDAEGVDLPELVGGIQSLNIVYPRIAKMAGIEGRVVVSFEVDEQGNVASTEIVTGIGGGCDEEAVRAIKEAKFKPATADGTPIRAKMTIPVTFKLPTE